MSGEKEAATAAATASKPTAAEATAPISEQEFGSSWRPHAGRMKLVLFWAAVVFAAFHLLNLNWLALDSQLFRIIHLAGGAALGFALVMARPSEKYAGIPWYDWLLIAACGFVGVYLAWDVGDWQMRVGTVATTLDFVAALVGTIVVLEFTRRTSGWALTIIALAFIVYGFGFVGELMPGALKHSGKPFRDWFIQIFSDNGVLGQTLEVSSTFIILFVIFAAFLNRSGAGDYFNDFAIALVGGLRGGPAKVAVLSGVMFGSISGSSVANVVASGTITIPMMRRVGYDRATAGAVEATSSTGGQITPPVLGAGAFIMAEVTGIKYAEIAWAAVIPCILFYVANYAHCHLHALKHGLRGIPKAERPRIALMLARLYYIAPIAILIYAFVTGASAFRAATLGMVAAILVTLASMALERERFGPALRAAMLAVAAIGTVVLLYVLLIDLQLALFYALCLSGLAVGFLIGYVEWRRRKADNTPFGVMGVARTFESGTKDAIQLIAVCAAAGIVAGAIATTGIGQRVSYVMLAIAGESKFLAMLFTMVIVTILGMGMPTTAAYAIGASVVAPGLTGIGVDKLVAHMFIFYYAIMSAITPPVAIASFAAAAMAKADPWKTSWIAVKIGLATFLVPFLFFYAPALLGQGGWREWAPALVTAVIGVWFLAAATEGWFNGRLMAPLRVVLAAAAILLMLPYWWSDLGGLGAGIAVFAFQFWRHGRRPEDRVPNPLAKPAADTA